VRDDIFLILVVEVLEIGHGDVFLILLFLFVVLFGCCLLLGCQLLDLALLECISLGCANNLLLELD
jgi:hypothetical protein